MNSKNFSINNKNFLYKKEYGTVLQACLNLGIEIPRFCYHKRLSIAGNCRMCLVEIEKSPKPMASCALPLMPDMKIFTETTLVKKSREGILEFLLANHPLDCPICDQGGECDLQDQSLIFGTDRGRFYESKRGVEDKNCGPLIKTLMTRCIHCTRCIRFSSEIAGVSFLGTTGRGFFMEVGSFLDTFYNSELSGNVIDLCPVGALTSKPYAFSARPWDLEKVESIDIFDSLNSNIFFYFKGSEIMRILPLVNEKINEEWISDKIRFVFDSLYLQRLSFPLIKSNKGFITVSWFFIFYFFKIFFKNSFKFFFRFNTFFGSLLDLETIFCLKKFSNFFYNVNIINNYNSSKNFIDFRDFYLFNFSLKNNIQNLKIKKNDVIFLIGIDFTKESPVLKSLLNQLFIKENPMVFNIGSSSLNFNYDIKNLGNSIKDLVNIFKGNSMICNLILKSKNINFFFGNNFLLQNNNNFLENFLYFFKFLYCNNINTKYRKFFNTKVFFSFFSATSSEIHAQELGLKNKNIKITKKDLKNYLNLNFFLDFFDSKNLNLNNLENDFLIYQGHHGDSLTKKANIILPGCSFVEKEGSFLNFEGKLQKARKLTNPLFDSRVDWEIFLSIIKNCIVKNDFNFFNILNLKMLRKYIFNYSIILKNGFECNKNLFFSFTFLYFFKNKKYGFLKNSFFNSFISNFYISDNYSKFSTNMSLCYKTFNKINFNLKKKL